LGKKSSGERSSVAGFNDYLLHDGVPFRTKEKNGTTDERVSGRAVTLKKCDECLGGPFADAGGVVTVKSNAEYPFGPAPSRGESTGEIICGHFLGGNPENDFKKQRSWLREKKGREVIGLEDFHCWAK